MDNVTNQYTNLTGGMNPNVANAMEFINRDTLVSKIIKVLLISAVIVIIIEMLGKLYFKYKSYKGSTPWLVKHTKSAMSRAIIEQDPSKEGAMTLARSQNESGGMEFSYSMWMFIDNWEYKYGQWKHVLHKGNESSWPHRAPGIWLHPKKNAIRVYMNTFKNIGEYADINNIPLNKWFHVAVCVRQRNMDLFINGNIVKRHKLQGIPKQNYGNVVINGWRGFSGFMSRVKYFDYYLSFSELDAMQRMGPSSKMPEATSKKNAPPYLPYNWWANAR
tara:strand:- start:692 stop:1516 length:825 start_codon:yes stop_codon:yes gene_type:complete